MKDDELESITRLDKRAPQPPPLTTSDPQKEEWAKLRASLERFWNTKPPSRLPPNITKDKLHRDRKTGLTPVSPDEIRRQIDALEKSFDQAAGRQPYSKALLAEFVMRVNRFGFEKSKAWIQTVAPPLNPAKLDPDPNPPKFGLEADAARRVDERKRDVEHHIAFVKTMRHSLEQLLQRAEEFPRSDEVREAVMRLTESIMWFGRELNRIATENPGYLPNPYPHSKDPSNTIIDPPADELRRKP